MNELWFGLLLSLLKLSVRSDEATHEYEIGEPVLVWVNKVGPFNNPTETYSFYKSHVPFCSRAEEVGQVSHDDFHYGKFDGLGSLLQGNELVHSGIPIRFRENQTRSMDCTMKLDQSKSKNLISAIKEKYWYQMYMDDLPVWGMIGEYLPLTKETGQHHHDNLDNVLHENFAVDIMTGLKVKVFPHFFSHKTFSISYNRERIIEVNITSEDPVLIVKQKKGDAEQIIQMTYSVHWIQSDIPFHRRFDRYLDFAFFEHQIHWFALGNSFLLVIFLVGMVSLLFLCALKKDYETMALQDDHDYDKVVEETGWKKLHGDVFRKPEQLPLFSALIGTGYQLYTSFLLVVLLAITGRLYDTRGTIATASVLTYSVTSLVSGFTSSQTFLLYSNKENTQWKLTMGLTGLLLPSFIFVIAFFLNILSVIYRATNAISMLTFLTMVLIWILSMGLLLVGTLIGRQSYEGANFPCAVNPNFVRPLPNDRPFYMQPIVFCLMVGILPFGSIFIEMYYIFNSFWNYKFYYVYGFMLVVFVLVTVVTACCTIVSTYLLLNCEDRRWKWIAVFSGGSTSLYVFFYATFYFFTKTQMTGLFQTSFYFGYMFLFSLAIFFVTGTIGYVSSSIFVRRIYDTHFD